MPTKLLPNILGGRYQLVNLIGRGAMGEVYRAFDPLTRQHVALKRVLMQPLFDNPMDSLELLDRRVALTQEFQTLASLRHSHIISVLDYGFDQDHNPYFTMDLLENAQTIVAACYGRTISFKISLLVQTLQALAYLHRRGILHRDLKPGNILVVNEQVKVVDFGLAWAKPSAADSRVVGTLAYMSPEALLGQPLTPAVDLYAVGTIAYELIAGHHPFRLNDFSGLVTAILETEPDLRPLRDESQTDVSAPSQTSTARIFDTTDLGNVVSPTEIIPFTRTERIAADDQSRALTETEQTLTFDIDPRLTLRFDPPPGLETERSSGQLADRIDRRSYMTPDDANSPLAAVIERLLRKRPQDRYQEANAVIFALSAASREPVPVETIAIRESFLQAARFIGRDAELGQLNIALSESLQGQGSVWLIGGESGVGKSRLLDELRIRALVTGTRVIRGQAIRDGQSYEVWREPLRHLILDTSVSSADLDILKTIIPDSDALVGRSSASRSAENAAASLLLDAEQAQKQLLEVIVSLINRQSQPLVIILEDLQWVRSESLALIQQLSQLIDKSTLLILGTYRDDESPGLSSMLPNAHVLKLNRLSEPEIAELSASMLGQVGVQPHVLNLLQRETEGNVFFLIETVRALAEEAGQLDLIGVQTLPQHVFTGGISRIVQRRLDQVVQADFPLLQLAAILGRQLDLTILRAAESGTDLDAWLLRGADNALLEIRDEHWRFSHDKLREGILAALTDAEQVVLHRKAAESIEAACQGTDSNRQLTDHAPALAEHWRQANEPRKEQQAVTLAGDRALLVGAHQEAIAYFQRALDLLGILPDLSEDKALHMALMLKLAASRIYAGLYPEAAKGLLEALNLGTTVADRRLTAEALALLGQVAMHRGDFEAANRYIDQSQQIFTGLGDQPGLAANLGILGRIAFYQGKFEDVSTCFTQSLAVFRHINNRIGVAKALGGLGNAAIAQRNPTQAIDYLQESLSVYQSLNFRTGVGSAMLTLSWVFQTLNEYEQANSYLRQALAIFREISAPAELASTINNLGYIAMLQKSYKEAQDWLEEGLAINRRIGDQWGIANTLANLGHIATTLNDRDHARDLFHEAGRGAKVTGAIPLVLEVLIGLATVDAQTGNYIRAAESFGMVMAHPALDANVQSLAEPLLIELKSRLSPEDLAAAIARGQRQDLDIMIDVIFAY